MKRMRLLLAVGLASATVGLVAGTLVAQTEEPKTNYLVIQEAVIGPEMSFDDGIARLSGWVRALRASGKHSSVRLFMHDWGPEAALYIVSETEDWDAIGTIFADIVAAAEPDFMKKPFGFLAHSDNILTEVPVE